MPDIIADLPAVSILLPVASVYFLWALFHWVFTQGDDQLKDDLHSERDSDTITDALSTDTNSEQADSDSLRTNITTPAVNSRETVRQQSISKDATSHSDIKPPIKDKTNTSPAFLTRSSKTETVNSKLSTDTRTSLEYNSSSRDQSLTASGSDQTEVPANSHNNDDAFPRVFRRLAAQNCHTKDTQKNVTKNQGSELPSQPNHLTTTGAQHAALTIKATTSSAADDGDKKHLHTSNSFAGNNEQLKSGGQQAATERPGVTNEAKSNSPNQQTNKDAAQHKSPAWRLAQNRAATDDGTPYNSGNENDTGATSTTATTNQSQRDKQASLALIDGRRTAPLESDRSKNNPELRQQHDRPDSKLAQPGSTPTHIRPGHKPTDHDLTDPAGSTLKPNQPAEKYKTAALRKSGSPVDEVRLQLKTPDSSAWNLVSSTSDTTALKSSHDKEVKDRDEEIARLKQQLKSLNEKQSAEDARQQHDQQTEYKQRYVNAQSELEGSARKIKALQATVNNLQTAGLAPSAATSVAVRSTKQRDSLLSKVRLVSRA